jgi:hypothetical protein
MRAMFHGRFIPGLFVVAQVGLALGTAGCELIDWQEVVEGINRPDPRPTEPSACAAILCPVDTVCRVRDVACVKEPCPPVAECVPIEATPPATSPCDTVRCAAGTHCEVREVQCVRAPCPPVAECVPDRAR